MFSGSVKAIVLLLLLVGAFLFSPASHATIKIVSVQGASASADLDGTTPTVWGGVAGDTTTNSAAGGCNASDRSDDTTCNNCEDYPAGDVNRLVACNNARIFGDLKLRITFSSDSMDGYPIITNEDGDEALTMVTTPTATSKGSQTTVIVRWKYVCEHLKEGNDIGDINCDPPSAQLSGTLKVGISKDNDSKLSDGDDIKSISFKVHKAVENTQEICDPADPSAVEGLCSFDVNPGDEKITLRDLTAGPNFPLSTSINFRAVRVYFSPVSFADIDNNSAFVDLDVDSNDSTTFTLVSDRVEGLENETKYYFKTALVDDAGNVGYFTQDCPSTNDPNCLYTDIDCANTQGVAPCHTAVPGKVVGVLEKDMNCFVATAAFGSPMAKQVNTFRKFRNVYLLPNKLGRAFVKAYYHYGPKAAHAIAKSETRKALARVALLPALGFAWVSIQTNVWIALLLTLTLFATPMITLKIYRRQRRA